MGETDLGSIPEVTPECKAWCTTECVPKPREVKNILKKTDSRAEAFGGFSFKTLGGAVFFKNY